MRLIARLRYGIIRRFAKISQQYNIKLSYQLMYFALRGKLPNLKHPNDISEYILSEMLKPSFLQYAKYADKYKVREYIKEKGLEDILIPCYGVWDSPDEINFNELPNSFILKANNGGGGHGHVICWNKNEFNIEDAREKLRHSLSAPFTNKSLQKEPHYSKITPKIICEQLIGDVTNRVSPIDYKFHCIHGKVYDIFLCTDRYSNTRYCSLNPDWQVEDGINNEDFISNNIPSKPERLSDLIILAEKLAADFPFVRVDLYYEDGKIFFSELTFSPWGGYMYSYTNKGILKMGEALLRK